MHLLQIVRNKWMINISISLDIFHIHKSISHLAYGKHTKIHKSFIYVGRTYIISSNAI